MSNISSWSTSAAANNSASPDGFPEGMAPSGLNDSAREVMGAIKRWYVDAEWRFFEYAFVRQSANSFLVSVTATDVFTAGRRLRLIDAGTTIYGDVIASGMSGANTLVTVSSIALSSSLSSGSVSILDPANHSDSDIGMLTSTASVTASDYVEVWQSGTGLRRRVLVPNAVRGAGIVLGTEQATTAGTAIDFTSIPSWVKRITVMFESVSTNGTSIVMIQIGDSGGIENAGYTSSALTIIGTVQTNGITGFLVAGNGATNNVFVGTAVLTLEDATNNTWTMTSALSQSGNFFFGAGVKSLSAVLDRVRLTTVNGTDAFDAGAVNIMYEG